jgi:hypothetical protein
MIDEMMKAATKAQIGYMQSGEPTPYLEFVMHPSALSDLRKEVARDSSMLMGQRREDGRFEFMNHVIREDSNQEGWKLQPVTT